MDPLASDYAWFTPYQFAGNTPIAAIDLDGLENVFITVFEDGSEQMQIVYDETHIAAMKSKTPQPIPFKITYIDKKNKVLKETTQFEGPNKENEFKIFSNLVLTTKGHVCDAIVKNQDVRNTSKEVNLTLKLSFPMVIN